MATTDDTLQIVDIFGAYLRESAWSRYLTFDRTRCWRATWAALQNGGVPMIVATKHGEIVGLLSWSTDHLFTTRPIANLHEVWAHPAYRRTRLGRLMFTAFLHILRNEGVAAVHATIASGLPGSRTLKNLMRKFGFEDAGYAMRAVL